MDIGDYAFFLKIILLGCQSSGKSNILLRYTDGVFEEKELTYNYDFKIKDKVLQEKLMKLQIWDTSTIYRNYFKSAHGFAIIIDLTNPDSFHSALYWKKELDNYFSGKTPEIILIGNKADLENQRFFTFEEAKKRADSLEMFYIEVSAKTNWNIEKSFEILIRNILHRISNKAS
ncbi:unnamed protein product [Blepharisma stoltei]|uniref:Uncharacterized protein n=1 Tax=Blepharisma stoltei TaxID=1481888 RepID=A0AAU9JJR4_9CILI|nr:unnamed protein product [Blepharisma stoltei]